MLHSSAVGKFRSAPPSTITSPYNTKTHRPPPTPPHPATWKEASSPLSLCLHPSSYNVPSTYKRPPRKTRIKNPPLSGPNSCFLSSRQSPTSRHQKRLLYPHDTEPLPPPPQTTRITLLTSDTACISNRPQPHIRQFLAEKQKYPAAFHAASTLGRSLDTAITCIYA